MVSASLGLFPSVNSFSSGRNGTLARHNFGIQGCPEEQARSFKLHAC